MKLVIPGLPPSVNHVWKHTRSGKHYSLPEKREFWEKMKLALREHGEVCVCGKEFEVEILVRLGKGDRRDVDASAKVVLDGLQKCGLFCNPQGEEVSDSYVTRLVMEKIRSEGRSETEIYVSERKQPKVILA